MSINEEGIKLLIPRLSYFERVPVPNDMTPDICVCGDCECAGVCDLTLYSVRQVIEFLNETQDTELLDDLLEVPEEER